MAIRDIRRAKILEMVRGAELFGVSYRHSKHLYRRYLEEGYAGILHKGRGRQSQYRSDPEFRGKVLEV